ncbi:MAG: LacI family DNA-binding transcriptional regulator [Rhodobacteraceae bacterium]|nr:LacI family DNA-binding transcriptional regulator [Paracoccaceae bacterium]
MANRPTVKDVAEAAGVSVTTVDRALNGRLKVREETLKRIAEAAHKIGYHGRGLLDQRLDLTIPAITFGFVLLKGKQEFYQNFARELERAVAARSDIRGKPIVRFAVSQHPDDFAEHLVDLGAKVDTIGAVAVNHHSLDQVVQTLQDRNVPVFSLLNDFGQGIRRNYLGLNNMKVGRLAAWMITNISKKHGKLAVFVGGNRWHGHVLREVGFRAFVRENAPGFDVLDTLVNLETRQVTYEATIDLLGRHGDLRGIYVAGGGMEGAIAALREARAPGDVTLVVNELTQDSQRALADGYVQMVIATPLQELCRRLVDMMIRSVNERAGGETGQHFLEPRVIVPEAI